MRSGPAISTRQGGEADDELFHSLTPFQVVSAETAMTFAGEVDVFTAARFRAALGDAAARSDIVGVDLRDVTFFGAVGVSPLLAFLREFGGDVRLSRHIERVLRLVG